MKANGFSLIEFLVVLSILAIVNFVLFPNIFSIQDSAKTISAKSIARNVMVGLEQYYFVNQSYPDGTNESIVSVMETLESSGYIQSIPVNPFTGDEYGASDESGNILYTYDESDGYSLIGYGRSNEAIIFESFSD